MGDCISSHKEPDHNPIQMLDAHVLVDIPLEDVQIESDPKWCSCFEWIFKDKTWKKL